MSDESEKQPHDDPETTQFPPNNPEGTWNNAGGQNNNTWGNGSTQSNGAWQNAGGQNNAAGQNNETRQFPPLNNPNSQQGQPQGQGTPGFANQPPNQPQWGQPPTPQQPAPNAGFSQGGNAPSGNTYGGNGSTVVSANTKPNRIGAKGVASIVGILVLLGGAIGGASYVWSNHHNGQKNDEAAPATSVTQSQAATPSANPTPGQETTEPAPRKAAINPTVNNDDTATDTTEESDDSDSSTNNSNSSSDGECTTQGATGQTLQVVIDKGDIDCADAQEVLKRYDEAPQGDGGPGQRSGNFQFWDSTTDDWSCVSPTYATAKRENRFSSCSNDELGASFFIPFDSGEDRD
ncbi:hypothetical protein [Corynebacterium sp.]|uniref:hypothetical protein n=1 Tax=Corynebacterium sp. TaxID=1720 RepID=UPI0026DBC5E7|nr:hypothetical protein [Corynebacterium sp.]MDO4915261.1 hypothetical protein [Corynebacterium sp.]